MTTETTTKKINITLSDRRPVRIVDEEWPIIASASAHDGQVKCQANTEWRICVREHEDGRRIVYCVKEAGHGGQHIGWRDVRGGFLIEAGDDTEDETVRAIRRCAGIIDRADLGDECIGDLPAVEI